MGNTLTVRIPEDLEAWLERESLATGLSKGCIIREALDRVRADRKLPAFLKLAGQVEGDPGLSAKRGFEP